MPIVEKYENANKQKIKVNKITDILTFKKSLSFHMEYSSREIYIYLTSLLNLFTSLYF